MAMGRPKAALPLSPEQLAQLESMAGSRLLPAGLVARVTIVLLGATGKVNQPIARDQFVTNDNQNARPFVWTATANSIFAKVQRLCKRISGTAH